MGDLRDHWDRVYSAKDDDLLSWHEDHPARSLELILEACPEPP